MHSARPSISSHPHGLTSRRRQHHTTITHTGLPKSAAPNSIIPVKCSFCRKRYVRAGAYETHLQSAHANLDIVLALTIRNPPADVLTDRGTDLPDANEPIEHPDSDYESDPAGYTAGSERDAPDDRLRREPETEVLEDNTYAVAAEQEDYPGAREAIGEVKEYVTTLQIGSYSGLDSSPYGIPSGNHIEDRPVYLVYYQ